MSLSQKNNCLRTFAFLRENLIYFLTKIFFGGIMKNCISFDTFSLRKSFSPGGEKLFCRKIFCFSIERRLRKQRALKHLECTCKNTFTFTQICYYIIATSHPLINYVVGTHSEWTVPNGYLPKIAVADLATFLSPSLSRIQGTTSYESIYILIITTIYIFIYNFNTLLHAFFKEKL